MNIDPTHKNISFRFNNNEEYKDDNFRQHVPK